jgi:hypothetical protein
VIAIAAIQPDANEGPARRHHPLRKDAGFAQYGPDGTIVIF